MNSSASLHIPDLAQQARELLSQIPPGRVATYGAVARALGDVRASIWTAKFLSSRQHNQACPDRPCGCHRVVRSDGSLGNFVTSRTSDKARRLAEEGSLLDDRRANLADRLFTEFDTAQPLQALAKWQTQTASECKLQPLPTPRRIAAVDVSYAADEAVASYVCMTPVAKEPAWAATLRRPTRFPYISTYLSFRELPILLALMEQVVTAGQRADVLLVDGSGILHPRGAGIATMLGVITGMPTIGVAKKRLCGQPAPDGPSAWQNPVPIALNDRIVGTSLAATESSARPLFVSPGHLTDVESATEIVQSVLDGCHRLPRPIYWADRLSREEAQQRTVASEIRLTRFP